MNIGNNSSWVQTGKLLDYYGYPVGVGNSTSKLKITPYPFRAYYKIIEDYFYDENLQGKPFTDNSLGVDTGVNLALINYKKIGLLLHSFLNKKEILLLLILVLLHL